VTAGTERELTPLEMARNLAASVHRYARQSEADQLGSFINQTGERAHAAAQLAANLATVSLAVDVHRIVSIMTGEVPADLAREAGLTPETADPDAAWGTGAATWLAPDEPGPVDDARATREHMTRWRDGDDTHPGEQP
jgi:hypothetical protein